VISRDPRLELAVRRWIHPVERRAEERDSAPARCDRRSVRGPVDAEREPRSDDEPRPRDGRRELARASEALRRGVPRPHHRHEGPREELRVAGREDRCPEIGHL